MIAKANEKPVSSLPGLSPVPVVGSRMSIIRLFSNPVGIMQKLYRECGEIGAISRGDPSLVLAFGPEYNQQLLPQAKLYPNFVEFPVKIPPNSALEHFSSNLTSMNGDVHRQQRRLMMPAFHKKVVQNYRDAMVGVVEDYLMRWPKQGTLDMSYEMTELTLAVMMRCLFGLELGGDADKLGRMSMHFLQQVSSPAVMMFPVNLPFTPYGRFLRFSEEMEKSFLEIIRERRAKPEEADDVLSILINTHDEDGASLTDKELIGQTGLLFVAGHETTSYAMMWTLFLLAQHPQIYADLLDELDSKLGGRAPTIEELQDLPLMESVIKESMRLIPPTPMLFVREGSENFQLGPYEMPARSKVVLSPLITHHMPELYDEPEKFKPERWQSIKPSAFEYLPFGAGPRMCLGAGFAELEIRIALPLIVQRFRLQLPENTKLDYEGRGITLGSKNALPMQIFPQDRNWQKPSSVHGNIHDLVDLT